MEKNNDNLFTGTQSELKKEMAMLQKKSYDGNCKFYFILQKYELMEALKCFIC